MSRTPSRSPSPLYSVPQSNQVKVISTVAELEYVVMAAMTMFQTGMGKLDDALKALKVERDRLDVIASKLSSWEFYALKETLRAAELIKYKDEVSRVQAQLQHMQFALASMQVPAAPTAPLPVTELFCDEGLDEVNCEFTSDDVANMLEELEHEGHTDEEIEQVGTAYPGF